MLRKTAAVASRVGRTATATLPSVSNLARTPASLTSGSALSCGSGLFTPSQRHASLARRPGMHEPMPGLAWSLRSAAAVGAIPVRSASASFLASFPLAPVRALSTAAPVAAPVAAAAASSMATSVQTMAQCMPSVVKVFTTASSPNYLLPWQNKLLQDSSGSGFIISDRRIITNAHVVADAAQVMVRRPGSATKYVASVAAAGHECDLAVLTVEDDEFWQASPLTELDLTSSDTSAATAPAPAAAASPVAEDGSLTFSPELPLLQDSVCVIGYPQGGDNLCVTQGVVSRIEPIYYAHAGYTLLGVQIDAAINPGNSGGPAFVDGRVVGVAFQNRQNASSVGYIIPVPIIAHFLRDVDAGGYRTVDRAGANLSGSAGADADAAAQAQAAVTGAPKYGFCGIQLMCQETFNLSLQRFMGLLPHSLRTRETCADADNTAAEVKSGAPARHAGGNSSSLVAGRSAAARVHIAGASLPQPIGTLLSTNTASAAAPAAESAAPSAAAVESPRTVADAIGDHHHLTGVLVNKVHRLSPCFGHLRRYDVLLALDDHPIAGDGSVHFRGYERISFDYLVSLKYSGDPMKITYMRRVTPSGEPAPITAETPAVEVQVFERTVAMAPARTLVASHGYDRTASYYVAGGMVFAPLSLPYLHEFGKDWFHTAPRDLVQLTVGAQALFPSHEAVVLTQVLPDASTLGYSSMVDLLVRRVNGRPVKSLRHLKQLVEEAVVRAALAHERVALPPAETTAADAAEAAAHPQAAAAAALADPAALLAALSGDNPFREYIAARQLALRPTPWIAAEDGLLTQESERARTGVGASDAAVFARTLGPDALVIETGDERVVMLEISALVRAHDGIMRKHNVPRQASVDL